MLFRSYEILRLTAQNDRWRNAHFSQSWRANLAKCGVYGRKAVCEPVGEISFNYAGERIRFAREGYGYRVVCGGLRKKQLTAVQFGGFGGIPKPAARVRQRTLKCGYREIPLAGNKNPHVLFRFRCTDKNIPPVGVLYRVG